MICPRCQSPLEDPSAKFCPLCGASVTPPAAPPPHGAPQPTPDPLDAGLGLSTGAPAGSPEPPPSAGPAAPQSSTAHCAVHADRAAVDICSRCGAFACRECLVIGADGQGVCSACLARQGGETGPLPWERRQELGFFKAYWETAKAIMFNPNTAFDRVQPETGKWWDPLSFAILSNFLGLSGTLVVYAFGGLFAFIAAMTGTSSNDKDGAVAVGIIIGMIVLFLVAIPLGAVMTAFIGGGIEHLTLRIVGVPVRPFEATVRTYCYSQAPMFWGVVPFCGAYAHPIWQIVCRIFGYKSMHRTTGGKAAAGVLLPVAVCCGAVMLFYGAIFAFSLAGKNL